MGLDKLPSGNYRYRFQFDGQRMSITFDHKPTQKEINQKVFEYQSNIKPKLSSFRDYAEKYIAIKRNVLSPSTIRAYGCLLNNLPDEFKNMPLNQINQAELQNLINDLSAKLSPKSVRNYNGFIIPVIAMFNPDANYHITLPQKKKQDDYIPSSDDIKAILSLADEEMYILIMLGAFGLRRSEIIPLTLDDIKDGIIDINKTTVLNDKKEWITKDIGKTETSLRKVPIPKSLEDKIIKQGYICSIYPNTIVKKLHQLQRKAGVTEFRFHLLRHYFATELSQNCSEADILALGGWSTDHVMKKVYRHNRIMDDTKRQKEIASSLGNKLS